MWSVHEFIYLVISHTTLELEMSTIEVSEQVEESPAKADRGKSLWVGSPIHR